MPELNKDVLFLIFNELQDDGESLYSCLLVNRTWCEVIVPILWKDHMKYLKKKKKSLNVIISHLSSETRKNLIDQGIYLPKSKKPLFNYIGFCKSLNLHFLKERIASTTNIEDSQIPNLSNEILKLFINRNTRITHLLIPKPCNYQIHLIQGAEYCFANLNFLQCRTNTDQKILEGLARISTSVNTLEVDIAKFKNNCGIIKFIEAQTDLVCVSLTCNLLTEDKSICKSIEESLISKHVDSIKYLRIDWKPITQIFLRLVNLISLEINAPHHGGRNYIKNASLPLLEILKVRNVPYEDLANLIKNTNGHLTEINPVFEWKKEIQNQRFECFLQAIYQNCPVLKYLQLSINERNISELENLLIHFQDLNGLVIINHTVDWKKIFKILARSSPISLYKFKFYTYHLYANDLRLIFDDWEGRHAMSLQIILGSHWNEALHDLVEQYKAKGIVKEFQEKSSNTLNFDDFEWI